MMNQQVVIDERPDMWVIVEFRDGDNITHKVLASFLSDYLNGDGWMMNSGIERTVDLGDRYHFYGFSGSVYECFKGGSRYAMSRLANQAYQSILNKLAGSPYTVRVLDFEQVHAALQPEVVGESGV